MRRPKVHVPDGELTLCGLLRERGAELSRVGDDVCKRCEAGLQRMEAGRERRPLRAQRGVLGQGFRSDLVRAKVVAC